MPIVGYPAWQPVIDANTREHVRFAMSDGRRLIPCRIAISTLRDCFGDADSEPIALFESFQCEIEGFASNKYEFGGVMNDIVEIKEADMS
ncbi:DUF1488 domain-containing protein [Methylobacterium sp. J-026]|uniref:DUF1488 family protein n=1 Tax=Methylobacterium sp. J-026 TaxID=2836624 RepID=UPI001FB9E77F|nr:DUF1488 family protein [Methylobacterium sp. J-026]MCJ2136979.1 DUF1488 domain-containing protein [Methylobacterium sp. J-026]